MTAWPGLPLAAHDTRSPINEPLVEALLDATQHDRESVYDAGAGQLPVDGPHVHRGDDSHLIVMPDVPNLVTDCLPDDTSAANSLRGWSRSGGVGLGNDGQPGLQFTRSGGLATTPLGDEGNKLQFAGCDLLISVLVRVRAGEESAPMTALALRFGITDGHVSTFAAGTRAEITQDDIGFGGYRRFYTIVRNFSSLAFSDEVRVGVHSSGSYLPAGSRVDVVAVVVKPCSVLSQFDVGYYTTRHNFLALVGSGDLPLWDDVLNFDRALYLAPT